MDDLISRQAALLPYAELYDDDVISVRTIRDNIKYLPTVQPEQNVGRWIKRNNPDLGICMQELKMCSVCGRMFCARYNPYWSYCGNCGAKMEEGE